MAYELRDLSGSLFKNNKDGVDSRPDYRGDCMIEGTAYTIAAWIKEGKKGKYMSLSFQVKADEPKKAPSKSTGSRVGDMQDDPFADVPF